MVKGLSSVLVLVETTKEPGLTPYPAVRRLLPLLIRVVSEEAQCNLRIFTTSCRNETIILLPSVMSKKQL